MAKQQVRFVCRECGAQSAQWIGRCPSCEAWNTYEEESVEKKKTSSAKKSIEQENIPTKLQDISYQKEERINLNNGELNRVLGGGLVNGSITLMGGEPGIGKSTLMLQVAVSLKNTPILYVSGEESEQQIKMRAERIGFVNEACYILSETVVELIIKQIKNIKPKFVVIDSVQTLVSQQVESSAGSITQIRETAQELQQYAKYFNIPIILIGHITKEGQLAGPKILEHIVDTVLQFEGDRNYDYRILRTIKNRFGAAAELGIFEMQSNGLKEVSNPSDILISQHENNLSGVAISATIEGIRPMLLEIQALVSSSVYGNPQRSTTGFDVRRLNMLLAVLEKRNGFRLSAKDVFLNIAGGIKSKDPGIDLAVIAAILSSNEDIPIDRKVCFAAEVGLSGEIRGVNRITQRILEAEKLGFKKIFVSKYNIQSIDIKKSAIEIVPLTTVQNLYHQLF